MNQEQIMMADKYVVPGWVIECQMAEINKKIKKDLDYLKKIREEYEAIVPDWQEIEKGFCEIPSLRELVRRFDFGKVVEK